MGLTPPLASKVTSSLPCPTPWWVTLLLGSAGGVGAPAPAVGAFPPLGTHAQPSARPGGRRSALPSPPWPRPASQQAPCVPTSCSSPHTQAEGQCENAIQSCPSFPASWLLFMLRTKGGLWWAPPPNTGCCPAPLLDLTARPPSCSSSLPSTCLPQGLCTRYARHLGPLFKAIPDHTVKHPPTFVTLPYPLCFPTALNSLSLVYPLA